MENPIQKDQEPEPNRDAAQSDETPAPEQVTPKAYSSLLRLERLQAAGRNKYQDEIAPGQGPHSGAGF